MSRSRLLATCLAVLAGLGAASAHAQQARNDSCSAAINCDCDNITDAGILNNAYRRDCKQCESRIVEYCRQRYTAGGDALQSIDDAVGKVGYCENVCSVTGPNPVPVAPAKRPARSADAPALPGWAEPMRLLCGLGEKPGFQEEGGVRSAGCTKGGKRNGLWILRDSGRQVVIEVYYRDGREVWRRERKA